MRKTRDLFKKIRDTTGTFHAKMGTIKDRNSKDLIEAEEIKKRQQEYTEELYKKGFNDSDNHDDMVTHLESDILECEVKWTLGSISMKKPSVDDGVPARLFQILKDDAVKILHSIFQQIWKLSSGHRTGKGKFSFQLQRRAMMKNPPDATSQRMFKLPHNCTHFTCQQGNAQNPSSQASIVCEPRTSRYTGWI